MIEQFIIYAVIGKLFIYALQKFPLMRDVKQPFLRELIFCNFCLGIYVFSILSGLFRFVLFENYLPYVPILSEIATGVITSFLLYLLSIGWTETFGKIVVER